MAQEHYVYEVPLIVRDGDARAIELRLDVARRVYNALLSEGLRRIDLMRESRDWRRLRALRGSTIRAIKAGTATGSAKETWASYNEARSALYARFELRGSYALSKYATAQGREIARWAPGCGLGAQVVQSLAARAWQAMARYVEALERGRGATFARPRFARVGQKRSVSGEGSTPAIRLDGNWEHVVWSAGKNGGALRLALRWPRHLDAHDQHARSLGVATVRLVRKTIRKRVRYYAQLTLKGTAYREAALEPRSASVVGLDVGFREVVAVAADCAAVVPLSADAARVDRELAASRRRLQRALDRSRRATNPDNYRPDGTVRPRHERKRWVRSAHYGALQASLAEMQRHVAAIRKTETGRVVNHVLPLGDDVRVEDLSYRSWQRGRTTAIAAAANREKPLPYAMRQGGANARVFAPGEFAARLAQRCAQYGSTLTKIAPTAKLSQLDHLSGAYVDRTSILARPFAARQIEIGGHLVQADLYQAFLARFASSEGDVDLSRARSAWAGAVTLLAAAGSTVNQSASGTRLRTDPRGASAPSSERIAAESIPQAEQGSGRRSGLDPRGPESGRPPADAANDGERQGGTESTLGRSTMLRQGETGEGRRAAPKGRKR
jgi:hypothetical protein